MQLLAFVLPVFIDCLLDAKYENKTNEIKAIQPQVKQDRSPFEKTLEQLTYEYDYSLQKDEYEET